MSPLVELRGATLAYPGGFALEQVDLRLERGDFLALVGPNGAGKTTVLRALLGLLAPRRGERALPSGPVVFGYVPQRETVDEAFPLSAFDVVHMATYRSAGLARRPGRAQRERALEALEAVGLADRADEGFRRLSGGQKQRVLLARALAFEPDVLALDEPTNGMDLAASHAVMELVHQLHVERGITVVLVSHLLNSVARWARNIGLLHEGRLELGPVDEILAEQRLREIYGGGVRVGQVDGERIVLPPVRLP